ncbi:hypothetical protein KDE12_01135 [Campylobacter sp. faydin G-105]|uniref:hypothetical protein n=1 Tax=Campylobacter anatolicus TaxID=2829105 RepID=UPI001B9CBEFB|nr:hypothetical protein [Campylobacter anatolicus]MBR8461455.1 hypothetical protein [Campylobacter anatolicus]
MFSYWIWFSRHRYASAYNGLEILVAHTQLWIIVVNLCVFIFLAFIIFASKNLGEIMRKSQDGELKENGVNKIAIFKR